MYMYRDLSVRYNSVVNTIASRTRVARERLAAIPVTSIVTDFSRGSLNK